MGSNRYTFAVPNALSYDSGTNVSNRVAVEYPKCSAHAAPHVVANGIADNIAIDESNRCADAESNPAYPIPDTGLAARGVCHEGFGICLRSCQLSWSCWFYS